MAVPSKDTKMRDLAAIERLKLQKPKEEKDG